MPIVRVYVPLGRTGSGRARTTGVARAGPGTPRTAYAVTSGLEEGRAGSRRRGPRVRRLQRCRRAAARLRSARSDRRVVAAAEPIPRGCRRATACPCRRSCSPHPVPLARVASFHVDDEVTGGVDEEPTSCSGNDVTELDDVRSFLAEAGATWPRTRWWPSTTRPARWWGRRRARSCGPTTCATRRRRSCVGPVRPDLPAPAEPESKDVYPGLLDFAAGRRRPGGGGPRRRCCGARGRGGSSASSASRSSRSVSRTSPTSTRATGRCASSSRGRGRSDGSPRGVSWGEWVTLEELVGASTRRPTPWCQTVSRVVGRRRCGRGTRAGPDGRPATTRAEHERTDRPTYWSGTAVGRQPLLRCADGLHR